MFKLYEEKEKKETKKEWRLKGLEMDIGEPTITAVDAQDGSHICYIAYFNNDIGKLHVSENSIKILRENGYDVSWVKENQYGGIKTKIHK